MTDTLQLTRPRVPVLDVVYTQAAGYYFQAQQLAPDSPLVALSLGVAYVRMVMQRKRIDRRLVTVLAFAHMFRYFNLCDGDQSAEACYNVGRAYHHLNLLGPATAFYKKALAVEGDAYKFETAHNLALIYKESGSPLLASRIIRQYCIV